MAVTRSSIGQGQLKAVIKVQYNFDKPAYAYGRQKLSEAGPGSLTVTMTMEAGQPSVLFEEETDLEEVWAANFCDGLHADQARYSGHAATNPKFGHLLNGVSIRRITRDQMQTRFSIFNSSIRNRQAM